MPAVAVIPRQVAAHMATVVTCSLPPAGVRRRRKQMGVLSVTDPGDEPTVILLKNQTGELVERIGAREPFNSEARRWEFHRDNGELIAVFIFYIPTLMSSHLSSLFREKKELWVPSGGREGVRRPSAGGPSAGEGRTGRSCAGELPSQLGAELGRLLDELGAARNR